MARHFESSWEGWSGQCTYTNIRRSHNVMPSYRSLGCPVGWKNHFSDSPLSIQPNSFWFSCCLFLSLWCISSKNFLISTFSLKIYGIFPDLNIFRNTMMQMLMFYLDVAIGIIKLNLIQGRKDSEYCSAEIRWLGEPLTTRIRITNYAFAVQKFKFLPIFRIYTIHPAICFPSFSFFHPLHENFPAFYCLISIQIHYSLLYTTLNSLLKVKNPTTGCLCTAKTVKYTHGNIYCKINVCKWLKQLAKN